MRRLPALTLLALAAVGVGACATKVVVLAHDAGATDTGDDVIHFPAPFCINYVNANGAQCIGCYDDRGAEQSTSCTPCKVRSDTGAPCVYCMDPAGKEVVRACEKCDPVTPGMKTCAVCRWSDGVGPCMQCLDATGMLLSDDCNNARSDLF